MSPALPLRGLLLCLAALALFACLDSTTKALSAVYAVPLVIAARYLVHWLLMVILIAPREGRALVRTQRTGLVFVRGACLAATSLCMGEALHRMPVAESTALIFTAPLVVLLAAGPLLHERIGLRGWTAAALGFSGALLIARPGGGLEPLGVAFALAGAVCNAAYQLLSRVLVRTEGTLPLQFHTALTGSVLYSLALPWTLEGPVPTPLQAALFVSMGITGGLGHYLFTLAFRHAPASVLAPVGYVQLLWAGLFGWLFFAHWPDATSLAGMAVVAAAGVVAAWPRRVAGVAASDAGRPLP